jgi:hypothetical protein
MAGPLENPLAREQLRFATPEGVHFNSLNARTHLAASLPPGKDRDKVLNNELHGTWEFWKRGAMGGIKESGLHERLTASLTQVEQINHPVALDLHSKLFRLAKHANPELNDNPHFNPMTVLNDIRAVHEVIHKVRSSNVPLPFDPLLQEAQNIANGIARIIGVPPPLWNMPNPRDPTFRTRPEFARGAQQIRGQMQTITQLTGTLVSLPLLASLVILNLRRDPKDRKWGGAAFWGTAAFASIFGHKAFEGRTDRWLSQVGFLGKPGGEYQRIVDQYHTVGPQWAQVADKLSSKDMPPEIRKIVDQKHPMTPEQAQNVLTYLAPGDPAVGNQLLKMITDPRTLTEPPGGYFRSYAGMIRQKRSDEAAIFLKGFIASGAGPAAFAAMPMVADAKTFG